MLAISTNIFHVVLVTYEIRSKIFLPFPQILMVGMSVVVGLLMNIQCRLKMVELRLHSLSDI